MILCTWEVRREQRQGSPLGSPRRALGWKDPTADLLPSYSVNSQPKSVHVLRSQLGTWFFLGKLLPCSPDLACFLVFIFLIAFDFYLLVLYS